MFLHVLRRVDKHPAGAGCWVADPYPLVRLEKLDDETHHRAGSVELTAFLPCIVGKPVD